MLEQFSLDSQANHDAKMKVLKLLHENFVVETLGASKLLDAKLDSMVLAHWGITFAEGERSLSVMLATLLDHTSSARQSINLVKLLLEWNPQEVTQEHWVAALSHLCAIGHLDILLASIASAIPPGTLSDETLMTLLDILGQQQPLPNHYFLLGLMSHLPNVQTFVLSQFASVHPNKRSYQITYRVLVGLGLYPRLPPHHRTECAAAVLEDREPVSLRLVAALISTSPDSTLNICRSWLGMEPGIVRGYRRWHLLEKTLLSQAQSQSNGVVVPDILDDMEHQPMDRTTLFSHLILVSLRDPISRAPTFPK
ncbi:hypothetical protein HDU91_003327 [Kappamyces sp. JEL0680]|nr:hypothetical protein HDU91_003327 [Kappamyces sp. JEL0680]